MTKSTVTVSPGASTPSPTSRVHGGPHALRPLVRIEQQVVAGEFRHRKEGKAQRRGARVGERRRDGEGARRAVQAPAWDQRPCPGLDPASRSRSPGGRIQTRRCHTRPCRPRRHPRRRGLPRWSVSEGCAGGVGTRGAARINGGAARDQGMGLGRPAVEGQRGIEDVRELDAGGGHHIRGAGAEALHSGGAVHAKEVVVVGQDRAIQ